MVFLGKCGYRDAQEHLLNRRCPVRDFEIRPGCVDVHSVRKPCMEMENRLHLFVVVRVCCAIVLMFVLVSMSMCCLMLGSMLDMDMILLCCKSHDGKNQREYQNEYVDMTTHNDHKRICGFYFMSVNPHCHSRKSDSVY